MTMVAFLYPCMAADEKLKFAASECFFLALTLISFWI